jgi:hypothetical protein
VLQEKSRGKRREGSEKGKRPTKEVISGKIKCSILIPQDTSDCKFSLKVVLI